MTEIASRLPCRASRSPRGSCQRRSRTEARAADELPKLGADLAATSVSGLSSGAYMAGQIQVAHSKDIVGAGIVAGGPYACAESPASRIFPFWPTAVAQNGTQALYQCMETTLGEPDPVRSAERAKELAEDGAIDPIGRARRRQRLSLLRQEGRNGQARGGAGSEALLQGGGRR